MSSLVIGEGEHVRMPPLDPTAGVAVVVRNTQPGVLGISAITSSGRFTVTTSPIGDEPGEVMLRDLSGDRAPDAAAVRPGADVVSVLRNTGGDVTTNSSNNGVPVGEVT